MPEIRLSPVPQAILLNSGQKVSNGQIKELRRPGSGRRFHGSGGVTASQPKREPKGHRLQRRQSELPKQPFQYRRSSLGAEQHAQALRQGAPVAQVNDRMGHSSESAFRHAFRYKLGETPGRGRKGS